MCDKSFWRRTLKLVICICIVDMALIRDITKQPNAVHLGNNSCHIPRAFMILVTLAVFNPHYWLHCTSSI